jgi:hypothetical protein
LFRFGGRKKGEIGKFFLARRDWIGIWKNFGNFIHIYDHPESTLFRIFHRFIVMGEYVVVDQMLILMYTHECPFLEDKQKVLSSLTLSISCISMKIIRFIVHL